MTRPTLKRMAVAAILATTTTATTSIYDDRNTEPQELVSSDIHNQNDKPRDIDEQHSIQTAADNRKRKHRQPLSIRRIDEEISTLSNTIQESASLLQHTQPKTTLIGQSYKIPPSQSQSSNEKVVVKGTVSTNDERMLGKIGNRAGLLAKRRNNNSGSNSGSNSGNNSNGNNNKNRTVGNGKKAGSNQNRNQGGSQSSGNNNKNGNNNNKNSNNRNRTNPNKKQRTQLPGQVRPGRQKKPGFRNRGGKLGLGLGGRRRGPRLFHDTSTHRWGDSGGRWSGGTRWYSKSSKSKGGKKWNSSWSIDDCWDTSSSWDLPSWPRPGDWERSYSIDWSPPSWGDDDWKPGWDDDDWKPGWKPKPPSWSGGWQWVDDWNGGGNWGGGGWWGKIEESLFPTESPELFPTLSPTLAPTLSPTLEPTLSPTLSPTMQPTLSPTLSPSLSPTLSPTLQPTLSPEVDNRIANRDGLLSEPEPDDDVFVWPTTAAPQERPPTDAPQTDAPTTTFPTFYPTKNPVTSAPTERDIGILDAPQDTSSTAAPTTGYVPFTTEAPAAQGEVKVKDDDDVFVWKEEAHRQLLEEHAESIRDGQQEDKEERKLYFGMFKDDDYEDDDYQFFNDDDRPFFDDDDDLFGGAFNGGYGGNGWGGGKRRGWSRSGWGKSGKSGPKSSKAKARKRCSGWGPDKWRDR